MVSFCIKIVVYEAMGVPSYFPLLVLKHKCTMLIRKQLEICYPTVAVVLKAWTV